MTEGQSTAGVVIDTSVLINLLHTQRLQLFCTIESLGFVVTPEVVDEVRWPEQRQLLDDAISAAILRVEALCGAESLRLYAGFRDSMGKGEAASLALAKVKGWRVASDDKGVFHRVAIEQLGEGKVLTTADLYLAAIKAGRLTTQEADRDKEILERYRFRMQFPSFADVLVGGSNL